MSECDTELLREIIGRGLIHGIGNATADEGQTCIEGAIALACGGDLSDSPPCVHWADRAYSIEVNDAGWSSPSARAEALLPLALAQVGTAGADRTEWARRVAEGTIRRVLPLALRTAATADGMPADHAASLRNAADRCEREGTESSAKAAYAVARDAGAARAAEAAARAAWAAGSAGAVWNAGRTARAAVAGVAGAARDAVLRESVAVALDAYRAEGRVR